MFSIVKSDEDKKSVWNGKRNSKGFFWGGARCAVGKMNGNYNSLRHSGMLVYKTTAYQSERLEMEKEKLSEATRHMKYHFIIS